MHSVLIATDRNRFSPRDVCPCGPVRCPQMFAAYHPKLRPAFQVCSTDVSVSAASRPISTSIIQFGETGAKPLFQQTPFLFGRGRHGFDLLDNSVETIEYFF